MGAIAEARVVFDKLEQTKQTLHFHHDDDARPGDS
jgi:hypothetical protein